MACGGLRGSWGGLGGVLGGFGGVLGGLGGVLGGPKKAVQAHIFWLDAG